MIRAIALLAASAWLGGVGVLASAQTAPEAEITAALPVIPDAKFKLSDYGAVGDYKAFDTDAFKKAIAAIAKAGGGHLIVGPGKYKTLPFVLTSHMDLHLEAGATIKAPNTFAEYGLPDPNQPRPTTRQQSGDGFTGGFGRRSALISCPANSTDIAITGDGTIDGSGAMFWIWSDKAARQYPPGRRIVQRPVLVQLQGVQRLLVDGVTLTMSPSFHLVPRGSDITIENVRIFSPADAPNTDAMDPSGQRIVIRKCEIDTGDDNVAVQAGTHDVLIEDLTCLHGHGISIGSGTTRGLSHMIVRRCTFDGADNGLRIKSYRGGGGEVHDVWYSDITMKNVSRPLDINMLYNGNANTPTDVGPRQAEKGQTRNLPNFHDIHFSNITVTRAPLAGRILGLPEQMPSDITFTNCSFAATRGFLVQDAKGVVFDGVKIECAIGEPLVLDNATVQFNGVEKTGPLGGSPVPFY